MHTTKPRSLMSMSEADFDAAHDAHFPPVRREATAWPMRRAPFHGGDMQGRYIDHRAAETPADDMPLLSTEEDRDSMTAIDFALSLAICAVAWLLAVCVLVAGWLFFTGS